MDSLQFRISEKGKFKATVSFRKDRKLKHIIAVAGLKILWVAWKLVAVWNNLRAILDNQVLWMVLKQLTWIPVPKKSEFWCFC